MSLLKNTCFLLPIALILSACNSEALQIVYPKTPNTEMSADSTFIIGNTTPDAKLKINEKEVKVYENGSFVEVVPLKDGFNRINIESKNDTQHDKMSYIIKKVPKAALTVLDTELIEFPQNEFIYASVVKKNTPLRSQPDEYAQRITHLDNDTVLMINGKKGDYYRVSLYNDNNLWVKADSVVVYSTINAKMLAKISDVTVSEDRMYEYIKTPMSFAVPFKVTELDKGLRLDLYNIKENPADTKIFKPTETIKSLAINTLCPDNKSTYYIELNDKLWGYDAYYENNTLVLKIRKTPQIDAKNPLKGITIVVDAGHGGNDDGAIGPTGVKEKNINLDIAKKLQKSLEDAGATVVMTRTDDSAVELYSRTQIAKKSDALIMLSIHANALPDGADPYQKHGTSTFYYNTEALELAKILRDTLTKNLKTKDDGVCKCSFVLTRPTIPLSVLIEVAYMIHPEEYSLLLNENFRQNAADSIKGALEGYMLKSLNSSSSEINNR